jgi:TolB-like protein
MPDIFISYSSKDREKAKQLTELLASAGLSVWIDHAGIDAATSWSKEIVQAIDGCKAFVVLLSASSNASTNVHKEVSLAAEKKKKILPLDLEPVALSEDLQYHLAGLQRAPMTNIDSIIRALGKMGLEATGAPQAPKIVKEHDVRKSLMILPFEDLSPTQDNGWFTDGIASELVSTLSNVKSLRLIDWNTSRMLKNKSLKTVELAREFEVRYFIEGQVRKFGDQIKIAITLLDIETGDHLWQDSLRGTMDDIFDIQEQCARNVLGGLNLHLTKNEEAKVNKKFTENAEAFELFLKASEYFRRHTKSDLDRALALYEEAVRLDPHYAAANASIASTCVELYRIYGRNIAMLERAEAAVERLRAIEGETARYSYVMSIIMLAREDAAAALRFARRTVEIDPAYPAGYDALGFACRALGLIEEAIEACEGYVKLQDNNMTAHLNLLVSLNELGSTPEAKERVRKAAERAIPIFEQHIRLNPDNYTARGRLANTFSMSGREAEALEHANKLSVIEGLDAAVLYNLACTFIHCHEPARAMEMLRRSVKSGYSDIEAFRNDLDLDPLRDTPEFQALIVALQ